MDYISVYNTIKQLENSLIIPEPTATVALGTLDISTGEFVWTVPTATHAQRQPTQPNGHPTPPVITKIGVVFTTAVELHLRVNVRSTGSPLLTAPHFGISTSPFPLLPLTGSLFINAGLIASVMQDGKPTAPDIQFVLPSGQVVVIQLYVIRPPVLGMGAFTLPALPITIVYAPPQGKDRKNTVVYTQTSTFTRNFTSGVATAGSTKTARAFSPEELAGKLGGAIVASVALVGTDGAASPSISGGLTQILSAISGAPAEQKSIADQVKTLGTAAATFGSVVGTLPDTTGSTTDSTSTETDKTTTLTMTNMQSYTPDDSLGPGAGDLVVMLRDVKVAWVAVNGDIGVSLLGYKATASHSINDMQISIRTAVPIDTHDSTLLPLDSATMKALIALDPFAVPPSAVNLPQAPGIAAPRFVAADPFEFTGSGSPNGLEKTITVENINSTKNIGSTATVHMNDFKPSWLAVLFGSAATNISTSTSAAFTTTVTTEDMHSEKMSCDFTFYTRSGDISDSYGVKFFYDTLFHTYLAVDANSPLLKGSGGIVKTH